MAENPKTDYEARYTTVHNSRLTVAKYRADGLTMEKIKAYYDNYCVNSNLISGGRVTCQIIDHDEGHQVIHAHIKTPIGFSGRSNLKV